MPKVLTNASGFFGEIFVASLGGSGVGAVDFGAGASNTKLSITGQVGIAAGSSVFADVLCKATASHSDDEHWVDGPTVQAGTIIPGVGFTIYASTKNTALYGLYSVSWSWA